MIYFGDMKLVLDIDPVAKGRPRFNGRFAYTPDKTRQFEAELRGLVKQQLSDRGASGEFTEGKFPVDGPVGMVVTFILPTKDKKRWGRPHAIRSDLDNIFKGTADAMNLLLYRDDCQISKLEATKIWGEKGRIEITVQEL